MSRNSSRSGRSGTEDPRVDEVGLRSLGRRGNVQLVRDEARRFPGLLIQGDTLAGLIEDLEEEVPDSFALRTARSWLSDYDGMMREVDRELPYRR